MNILTIYFCWQFTFDAQLRVKRVQERELKEFGERILSGGDMFGAHQQFLKDVENYDCDAASCNSHQLWTYIRVLN